MKTIVKRFSKASDAAGLRALWRDSYDRGEISGAYWAILTHPASDQALVRDVFGDVHMLSHLVGSSSRLDIARLNALQTECDRQTEKIDRQETRLMMHALKQREMQRRIDELEASLIVAQASRAGNDSESSFAPEGRLAVEKVHTKELTARLRETEIALERAEACARQHEGRAAELQMEIERLDAMFSDVEGEPPVDHPAENLGATILYVGGRKNLFNRMRGLAERCGLALLIHDGGVEDSTSLLPAMIGQAEAVIFPVDHISHTAAGVLKRVCRDNGTPYVPLRSASLTSFAASIGGPLAKQIGDSRQLRIGAALATTS